MTQFTAIEFLMLIDEETQKQKTKEECLKYEALLQILEEKIKLENLNKIDYEKASIRDSVEDTQFLIDRYRKMQRHYKNKLSHLKKELLFLYK